jgi:hypothetical protein
MELAIHSFKPVETYIDAQVESKGLAGSTLEVNPKTLAHLNFGIFRQLRKLGTSKERICSVLGLSPSDYDYIEQLGLRRRRAE